MSRKESKISIKWRIFAYFAVFTVILLGILWICQTVLLDTIYKSIKTDSLKKCVNEISYAIGNEDYSDTVEDIARSYDVSIKIVDANYETLYSFAVSPTNIIDRISGAELFILCNKAGHNGGEFTQSYRQIEIPEVRDPFGKWKKDDEDFSRGEAPGFFNGDMLMNLVSVKIAHNADGNRNYILVDSVITPVSATARTLVVMLGYVSVITVILALVLAFVLAKKISSPIVKMNKKAQRLAKGDFSTRFDSSGYAEIEQLNETMNYAATELSRVQTLQRELVANVSHDLRTPLTMIIGYSEIMRDIPGENSPENVQVIIDEAARLSSLVTDLLDISRFDAGNTKLAKSEYNLTESIRKIITRFDKLKENDGYSISFESDGDVNVFADENRLSQAIYNLIINAINYTGTDKSIRVVQKRIGKKVRVEVIDTGEGIAKADLPYIWDRYYKVDKTHKRAIMGTGLGLSIVKSVLEAHSAVYGVDSIIGEGTTFWFEI